MLKKQTVWLLTMLSLMVVLSIYYIMSSGTEDLAYINNGENNTEEAEEATEDQEVTGEAEVDGIRNLGSNEVFTTIRMEIQDTRSMKKDRLSEVVASSASTSEEKSQALEEMDVIENLSAKEKVTEESIINSADYKDVLVRSQSDKVHVHVQLDEALTKTEVVNIMQMVRDEFGDLVVDVVEQVDQTDQAE